MNNASLNRFTINPTSLDMKRSRFSRPFKHTTTFDAGKLIPFYLEEVLPGDTVSLDLACLVRMTTPIHPVMDNAYIDFHFYFVPNRLVWQHWENFMGQNDGSSPWLPPTSYSVPYLTLESGASAIYTGSNSNYTNIGVQEGSVANYMGIPLHSVNKLTTIESFKINVLPFRAYALIWNQWYRDEAIMAPVNLKTDDTNRYLYNYGCNPTLTGSNNMNYIDYITSGSYISYGDQGGAPLPVCKFHDYFTSSLPAPQRGPDVTLPLGNSAPVKDVSSPTSAVMTKLSLYNASGSPSLLTGLVNLYGNDGKLSSEVGASASNPVNNVRVALAADLSSATAATINTIRWAFQLQKYYEKLARGGSRYNEFIQSFFGVHVPDERLQRTEFLGGRRIPINMTQVAQTSSTDSTTPQGHLAAFSQTPDNHSYFTKSFVEHGYLIGVCMVRTDRTYQDGIAKKWLRRDMIDFYNPVFANIGEQPIRKIELFYDDSYSGNTNNDVFGYQEAWAEYRYSPNRVSGAFSSNAGSGTLDSYHYADHYSSAPTLSTSWLMEPQSNLQRTLAVSGVPQFLADIQVYSTWTRVMPLYSIPGLVDHH